ncbi:hypothetical protein Syun_007613 [Stephania yunnanensis]|uniref:Uncharacterized protein n=1 Tax=Stephania yunnanensis TaxID=152371 RepID=A0AAP0PYP0_9MAGN
MQERDLDFSLTVIASEIVRESDGLALSSCNIYLSPEERKKVCCLLPAIFFLLLLAII